ncbi:nucleoside hydrolase [Saccharopolyspora aridisoli]|uniref:nucleoside hydrolase n=1 Tax=Saccharopolyspora aridisoli TaxID=2530385 RepID=UPI001F38BF8B|nr:nucleoside hydrolase [Saccharopolyspora aridisoli]
MIDTDTAQDDCITLLVGLLDPRAELRAITMVAGNIGFDQQIRNAFLTLNVAGRLGPWVRLQLLPKFSRVCLAGKSENNPP